MVKIESIYIDEWALYSSYSVEGYWKKIPNINRVNFFVWPTNSGKSRLMRAIFSQPSKKVDIDWYAEFIDKLQHHPEYGDFSRSADATAHFFGGTFLHSPFIINDWNFVLYKQLKDYYSILEKTKSQNPGYPYLEFWYYLYDSLVDHLYDWKNPFPDEKDWNCFYIPILRNIRSIGWGNMDVFQQSVKDRYFSNPLPVNHHIFTGQDMYDSIRTSLLWYSDQRKNIQEYEEFISHNFFSSKPVTIIPMAPENKGGSGINSIHLAIEWLEHDMELHNLWDGIQSILLLLYPMFQHRNKSWFFFIEEPELYMHPWLQRLFLKVLLEYEGFHNHTYFFTTHSNHFLDIAIDDYDTNVSIYRLEREDVQKYNIIPTIKGDISLIKSLWVNKSSVFLTNCTIRVEGITDRYYIRRYLDLYMKKHNTYFSEDIHYSFVEYAWSNAKHWSFLADDWINIDRLCGAAYIISDNLSLTSKKNKWTNIIKEKMWDDYYNLSSIEIENTLAPHIIQQVIWNYEWKTLDFNFEHKDYFGSYLGLFIDTNVQWLSRSYWDKGTWTVSDKVNFCNKALRYMNDWNDLTSEAQRVANNVYTFIKTHNKL